MHFDYVYSYSDLPLKMESLNLDIVYENFVRQVAGDRLQAAEAGESLRESVVRDERMQALKRQIVKLQADIRKEKQINVQVRLNKELKEIEKEVGYNEI